MELFEPVNLATLLNCQSHFRTFLEQLRILIADSKAALTQKTATILSKQTTVELRTCQ